MRRGTRHSEKHQPARGQIELSTLGMSDLQRLLEVARTRGQAGLAEQLLAEIDARRQGGVTPPATAPARLRKPRRGGPAIVVVAVSAVIGASLAWGLGAPRLLSRDAAPAPRAMIVETSLLRAPAATIAPAAPPPAETSSSSPAPRPAAAALPGPHNACLDRATPGERLLCGYPSLTLQDHRLAAVYKRALRTSSDPIALAAAQVEWRSARNAISDRQALSDFYAARIAELEAVAPNRQEPAP